MIQRKKFQGSKFIVKSAHIKNKEISNEYPNDASQGLKKRTNHTHNQQKERGNKYQSINK